MRTHPIFVGIFLGLICDCAHRVWGSPHCWIITGVLFVILFFDDVWVSYQEEKEWAEYKRRCEEETDQRLKDPHQRIRFEKKAKEAEKIATANKEMTLDEFHEDLVKKCHENDKFNEDK